MTLERMQEIHQKAKNSFGEYSKHMTQAEKAEVYAVWDNDPSGFSSFASTFLKMMKEMQL